MIVFIASASQTIVVRRRIFPARFADQGFCISRDSFVYGGSESIFFGQGAVFHDRGGGVRVVFICARGASVLVIVEKLCGVAFCDKTALGLYGQSQLALIPFDTVADIATAGTGASLAVVVCAGGTGNTMVRWAVVLVVNVGVCPMATRCAIAFRLGRFGVAITVGYRSKC